MSPSDTVSLLPTSSSTSSPTPRVSKTPVPTSTPVAHTYTATFTAQGISPSQLNIKVGDTVKFINQDSAAHWPASDPHPTHTICPGFDALRGLAKGESYSFKFTVAKTCPFHDHLNAFNKLFSGTIIISN